MALAKALLSEIEHESKSTRKLLELVPVEHFDWRPHEKSMTLKGLAIHIAQLASYPGIILSSPYLDFAENTIKKPEIDTTEDLLKVFQQGNDATLNAIRSADETVFNQNWILRKGEHLILDAPRSVAIRQMGLNHLYHHRAQLGVYLRLLNIPIPGMYGPSSDEMAQFNR
ncbi:MAG: DinB family protein [Bacteroidetes bacterium]|jgi:uncharacterized damage-inducible protein DinB|nr:DinB family protein [Bacteroidota bacterium]